jgi:AcrR family transcriptional regulator
LNGKAAPDRLTQEDRRTRARNAILEMAARGLSRHGYRNLVLARVASEAGYSRGALYHHFADKEQLALAVVHWAEKTWYDEVGHHLVNETNPVEALLAVARGIALYSRRDVASVLTTLRAEFDGHSHPIGEAVHRIVDGVVEDCARLIIAARHAGAIPPGPPPAVLALAFAGAIEGLASFPSQAPHDVFLAEQAARGILGLTLK